MFPPRLVSSLPERLHSLRARNACPGECKTLLACLQLDFMSGRSTSPSLAIAAPEPSDRAAALWTNGSNALDPSRKSKKNMQAETLNRGAKNAFFGSDYDGSRHPKQMEHPDEETVHMAGIRRAVAWSRTASRSSFCCASRQSQRRSAASKLKRRARSLPPIQPSRVLAAPRALALPTRL